MIHNYFSLVKVSHLKYSGFTLGGFNMNWVSVEDGLPEIGIPVFTIGVFKDKPTTNHVVAQLNEEGKWLVGYTLNGERYVLVVFETFPTHWHPLPEPPKN